MKKQIVLIAAAFAALFAVSCTKETPVENTPVQGGMREVTITASVDQETKTAYDAAGAFSWHKGDQISVMGKDNKFYTFTANSTGASTTFTGKLPAEVELGDYAYYPASDKHYVESWQPYFYVAETKDLTKAFSADLPMTAKKNADTGAWHFKHSTSALMYTFNGIPDEIETAEVTFVTSNAKFSGHFKVINGEPCYWNTVEAAETELEKTYARKVSVANNSVQFYVPWFGTLWDGWTYKLTVVGYDAQNNETVLFDVNMPGNDLKLKTRGEVIPVAPLTYVPKADFAKVDWTNAQVVEGTSSALTKLEYCTDSYYVYARLQSPLAKLQEKEVTALDIFLYDVIDGTAGNGFWGNFAGSKGNVEYEPSFTFADTEYNLPEMTIGGQTVEYKKDVVDGVVTWTLAFSRGIDVLAAPGKAYFGFMLKKGNDAAAAIPSTGDPLLEIVLP